MIMRQWRGRVPASKATAYLEFLKRTGLKDYAETPGNLGVYAFERTLGEEVEFELVTFWDSVEAIKRYAGEDYEKANYYPEDKDFLLSFEPLVDHFDVVFASLKQAALEQVA